MRNLLDFLSRHNHWFVFLLLEVVSLTLLFKYNSYQGSVWFSSANAVAGKMYEWDSSVKQYFALTEVNRQLTDRNIYLEREVEMLREQVLKTNKDTTLVERLQQNVMRDYETISGKRSSARRSTRLTTSSPSTKAAPTACARIWAWCAVRASWASSISATSTTR